MARRSRVHLLGNRSSIGRHLRQLRHHLRHRVPARRGRSRRRAGGAPGRARHAGDPPVDSAQVGGELARRRAGEGLAELGGAGGGRRDDEVSSSGLSRRGRPPADRMSGYIQSRQPPTRRTFPVRARVWPKRHRDGHTLSDLVLIAKNAVHNHVAPAAVTKLYGSQDALFSESDSLQCAPFRDVVDVCVRFDPLKIRSVEEI